MAKTEKKNIDEYQPYFYQIYNDPPFCRFPVTTFAGLLRSQTLNSSAPQPFPLPLHAVLRVVFVVVIVIFFPVTRSLFA